jgi:hypothetical protein
VNAYGIKTAFSFVGGVSALAVAADASRAMVDASAITTAAFFLEDVQVGEASAVAEYLTVAGVRSC